MFRLIKLLSLLALGYVLYEFYQGFGTSEQPSRQARGQGQRRRAPITGGGKGAKTRTHDSGGTSSAVTVGRGVVRR